MDIIDDLLKREGGYANHPEDKGGRTDKGISERSHPQAWADGQVTDAEARQIYEAKYLKGPGFDKVADERLRAQLVDFGVNSGPRLAIMKLQEILHVDVDGVLGPKTLSAIHASDPITLNNKLARARLRMIGRLITKNPSQAKFASGWINRVLEFFI